MPEKSQLDKFKDAAREAECDMDEEKFDQALKKVAKKPKPDEKNASGTSDSTK